MWMLFGLAIGLSVAFAIYNKDLNTAQPVEEAPATTIATTRQEAVASDPVEEDTPDNRFTFYSLLPKFEVIIPEKEPDVSQDSSARVIEVPGIYVLQAGSFSELADADRRRAGLALLGIESRIQRVAIDDRTYHRVRIGPLDDLDKLNRIRDQLRQAKIDVLRIRLGD